MQKFLLTMICLIGIALFISGCGAGTGHELSKNEEDRLRNPSKTIPPEAIEGMKKTMEENAKRGRSGSRESESMKSGG